MADTTTAQGLLETVQDLKDELFIAMCKGRVHEATAYKHVNDFLIAHNTQILDILDDALYAHCNPRGQHPE